MKAMITVLGKDRVGIIAGVSQILAQNGVNILDISQTILSELFAMFMLVDISEMTVSYAEMVDKLNLLGDELGMQLRMQRTEIFEAMHRL